MNKTTENPSYFDRLKLDPKMLTGVIASYITNMRLVILLTLTIAFLGIFSYLNLPQRLNPEIKIPIVTVVTALPGAGPEDVEKLVTIPIEDKLRGLTGLDVISSVSQNNVSFITLQFLSTIPVEEAKVDVDDALGSSLDLPEDATDPNIESLDFENTPVWQFAVTTLVDPISLFTFSKDLREAISDVPEVNSVTVRGIDTQVIAVDATPEKLTEFGLMPMQLASALSGAVGAYPAGTVETSQNSFAITIDPSVTSIDSIRNMRTTVGDQTVRLGDIATVSERSSGIQPVSYLATPEKSAQTAVNFAVYKRQNADIVKTVDKVKKIVEQEINQTGDKFTVTSIVNTGELIQRQFSDLLGEFRSTMILVFGCLLLFLGLRQAAISALTVPLTFLSAFFFMSVFGMSINFLSLFAFLLSLGLLVDDTIVVVSAMTAYYKTRKFTPTQTGLLVWRDTIVPIWSTTLTTIWSFVPLLLSTGIIGEFIKPIPVVVTITMISSTAIAVLVTLPTMIVLLNPSIPTRIILLGKILLVVLAIGILVAVTATNGLFIPILIVYLLFLSIAWRLRRTLREKFSSIFQKNRNFSILKAKVAHIADHGIINIDIFARTYERFITKILQSKSARRKVVIAIIGYSLFSFLLLPLGLVQNEFFPKADGDVVYVNLELPTGTTIHKNDEITQKLLEKFRHTSGIQYVVADIGTAFSGGFGGGGDQANTALFTFHLPQKETRSKGSIEIADQLRRDNKDYTEGKLTVVEESGGPPAGADVQLTLLGDDLATLHEYTDKVAAFLENQEGILNVEKSIKPGVSALVFVPDEDILNSYGLNSQTLGLWLRIAVSGFTLKEVNFDSQSGDKKNVVFSFGLDKQTPESLGRLMIPTSIGPIPLSTLGVFRTKSNPTTITREDGKRTMTVSAGVARGFPIPQKNQELLTFSNSIPLPAGYAWQTGGVNEENQKSVTSIMQAMVVALLLILVTMVVQFKSFRQALIVLLVIPLAVSSVFLVFAITGTPLSFPALIGVLSLFGIVVTNSMFIVDKINLNRKQGIPFIKAIADAGASRMEPIVLTKLATVLGLLPITISDPLWRGLGGAIISGLLIASTIMLLFIPVVYYSWMKSEDK